jgi:hypothetical protein
MPKKARRIHRLLGLILLLPCLAWAATGLLFHWKPGWSEAYAQLSPKTYPLNGVEPRVAPDPGWIEMRRLRTILGEHLLVRTDKGWRQLDVASGGPREAPSEPDRIALFEDAIAADPGRYGSIESIEGWTATTTTGVEISLDWKTMRFRQTGADTRRIDLLYRIHYLQWTGTKWGDRALPLVGLIGLSALALLGLLGLRLVLRN